MVRGASDPNTRAEQHGAARDRRDHPAPGYGQGLAAASPSSLKGVCTWSGVLVRGDRFLNAPLVLA